MRPAQTENKPLVGARFEVDGSGIQFWGCHEPANHWNGWSEPRFSHSVATLIANWLNGHQPGTAWWAEDVLCVYNIDGGYSDQLEPDELGLYRFHGWAWRLVAGSD